MEYRTIAVRKEILRIEAKLKNERSWYESDEDMREFKALERRHVELVQIEETIWRQRSKTMWLKD